MALIRQLISTALVTLILTFALIGAFGGYQFSNNIQMNATLAQDYSNIVLNTTGPGGLFNLGPLNSQATTQATQIRNATIFSAAGAAVSSLTFAGQFIVTIPAIFYSITSLVSAPFIAIGIPVGYVNAVLNLALLILLVLGLLSALFIFPL